MRKSATGSFLQEIPLQLSDLSAPKIRFKVATVNEDGPGHVGKTCPDAGCVKVRCVVHEPNTHPILIVASGAYRHSRIEEMLLFGKLGFARLDLGPGPFPKRKWEAMLSSDLVSHWGRPSWFRSL